VSLPSRSTLGLLADVVPFSWVDGPGNRYVVFAQGCTFDCIACHNPSTIVRCSAESAPRRSTVRDLLAEIREVEPFLSGVTVSGGEATVQTRFVKALFWAIKQDPVLRRLTTFLDSNGDAPASVWKRLLPVMDGAMIDLKALDPVIHRRLTGRSNERVLASIRQLADGSRLHEVRLLVVPGFNDDPDQLRRTGEWLAGVDPGVRTVVIGFRAHGVRPAFRWIPEPSPEQLARHREVLVGAGLTDVAVV
jgi:pyruvate formate lyase activating enzyme